jgi:hypothetical protein
MRYRDQHVLHGISASLRLPAGEAGAVVLQAEGYSQGKLETKEKN